MHNSWISSSYVYGPYGWCHPDGQIGYEDNVGKWPSVGDIMDDWKKLAEAFPYLDLGVSLMTGEQFAEGNTKVVSMRVKNGQVTLVDPEKEDVHAEHPKVLIDRSDTYLQQRFMRNYENYFTLTQIKQYFGTNHEP